MSDSVYAAIMKPTNQCPLMGIEKVIKSEVMGVYRVTVSKDNFGQYRATLKDRENDLVVSAILFDQFRVVRYKFTLAEYRGQRLTKQLFAYTELVVKRMFRHSDNMTEAGKASA